MKRKCIVAFIMAAIMAMALFGCGGTGNVPEPAGNAGKESQVDAPSASGEAVVTADSPDNAGSGEKADDGKGDAVVAPAPAGSTEEAKDNVGEKESGETAKEDDASEKGEGEDDVADESGNEDAESEKNEDEDAAADENENEDEEDAVEIRVLAMKGPTAMGMVRLMDLAEKDELEDVSCTFQIVSAVDEVAPLLVKGEVDIAALPANLAAVLYNNTSGGLAVTNINTLGILYIVENGDSVQTVEDLKGRTIYASGKGATPEYALNYVLSENGIDPDKDVTIEWKSEHAECLAALLSDESGIAMLPQPFVTTAQMKEEGLRTVLDLTEEWEKLQEGQDTPSALLTGVTVVRKEFLEAHPDAVDAFLSAYAESVDYVNSNVDEAAALVGKYDIVPEAVAKKAIPACNIVFIDGDAMRDRLSGYLSVLYGQNEKAVGGALPEDDFYYVPEW